jgi:two-component system phosphate regulon sensor histidine kinase PhoR
MDKSIRKIIIILVFIVLMPALFFAVYEINSLTSNEQMIEQIYNNQVESILYSVNQFSEDIINSWRSRLKAASENKDRKHITTEINRFLQQNNSVRFIFFGDSTESKAIFTLSDSSSIRTNKLVRELFAQNKNKITRLFNYTREGYFKIEPLPLDHSDLSVVIFVIESAEGEELVGLGMDPLQFIKQVLPPKIRSVSQDEFIISVFGKNSRQNIYSSEPVNLTNIQNERPIWLFPDYLLGIVLKGGTIQSLVKSRAETNLVLLLLLIVILLVGVWIIFRNVKKEVALAKIKSDFVSNVSHELRTPLALISMFAETLEMGRVKTEEKKKEYYSIISHEANRLSKIVNRILNFSQAEAGKRKFSFAKVQLNEIVESVVNTYSFHLQNKGFKFISQPDETIPLIYADKDAVSEAIINLIDNAVKYSQDKKEVELSTGMIGDLIYIKVKDQGVGISEKDQKRIFDKFFRVAGDNIHNTKGTGLGLSLVKQIVEAHKGEITLHSTPGKGSSFILKFKQYE